MFIIRKLGHLSGAKQGRGWGGGGCWLLEISVRKVQGGVGLVVRKLGHLSGAAQEKGKGGVSC